MNAQMPGVFRTEATSFLLFFFVKANRSPYTVASKGLTPERLALFADEIQAWRRWNHGKPGDVRSRLQRILCYYCRLSFMAQLLNGWQ